jgi:serine/threonine protein kinase
MDHYQTSLRSWRVSLGKIDKENLPASAADAAAALLPLPTPDALRLCLDLYRKILDAMATMQRHGIVHYDIKADNILVVVPNAAASSSSSSSAMSGWNAANFLLSFADFGQSSMQHTPIHAFSSAARRPHRNSGGGGGSSDMGRAGGQQRGGHGHGDTAHDGALCWIGRGTENIQAPEMLSLSRRLNRLSESFDRRKQSVRTIFSFPCFELCLAAFEFGL